MLLLLLLVLLLLFFLFFSNYIMYKMCRPYHVPSWLARKHAGSPRSTTYWKDPSRLEVEEVCLQDLLQFQEL